jgi:CheY-like chemotaxis protein
VKEIGEAAERAAALTEQLLAFGKRQMVRPRAMDLNCAILRMQDMLESLAGENIAIDLTLEQNLDCVKMDPIQVDQVLINLTANARDAMPNGGAISIRTFNDQICETHSKQVGLSPGAYVCLWFSDNGQGMNQETQSHIFEPFYTTKRTGHGLGLSTVYSIVQQSGGRVAVRSAPGEGASFTLYLPRTTDGSQPETALPKTAATQNKRSILVAEDETSLRAIVAAYLRECGHEVCEAADAQEAAAISSSREFDLLLTDILMPGASGPALAAALAEAHPQMKVIFMSGYADHASLQEALRPNMLFLQKPFRLTDLMARIQQALAGEINQQDS